MNYVSTLRSVTADTNSIMNNGAIEMYKLRGAKEGYEIYNVRTGKAEVLETDFAVALRLVRACNIEARKHVKQ